MKKIFVSLLFLLPALFLLTAATAFSQAPRAGWTSLFDGKTLSGWKTLGGSAKYYVEDNAIVGITVPNSRNTFLASVKEYDDFVLELDVKVEDTTINSGIQFRSHFNPEKNDGEGQVYGYQYELDPGYRNWTAGIYDEARRGWLYPGSLNVSPPVFRVGAYNKVRIECSGNEITTWLNGQIVSFLIDDVDASGFIGLQVHSVNNAAHVGKKVYWKNIYIKPGKAGRTTPPPGKFVVNLVPNHLSDYQKKNGWKLLFDGKSSNGWVGAYQDKFPSKGWAVENGILSVLPSNGGESTNGGDIVTSKNYKAFDLTFDFRLSPGANSGVKYFVTLTEGNKGSAIGLEYQLLDDQLHPDAKMGREGNRTLASLYDLIRADKQDRYINKPGEWNRGRIVVYPDNRVEHYLNGVLVLRYIRGSENFRQLVAMSKYKVWKNFGEAPEGRILLQDHGNQVSFRSIRIKELK